MSQVCLLLNLAVVTCDLWLKKKTQQHEIYLLSKLSFLAFSSIVNTMNHHLTWSIVKIWCRDSLFNLHYQTLKILLSVKRGQKILMKSLFKSEMFCYIQIASHTATQRFIKYNEFILNKVQVQSFLLHCSCQSVFFVLDFISTNLMNRWLR